MERLPPDLFALVCASLTGFDVFRLSQTSVSLRRATDTDRLWRHFIDGGCGGSLSPRASLHGAEETDEDADAQRASALLWKKEYVRARSLQFHGLPVDDAGRSAFAHGSFVVVREPQRMWTSAFTHHFGRSRTCTSVSIDLWFSLLPETGEIAAGGILFGLQSTSAANHMWPYYHQQPILVDSNRRLYCSLLNNGREQVGPTLDVNRWYHLALTYSGQYREEKIYLDGKLALERSEDWNQEWGYLSHAQVGSGCITAGERSVPVPGYIGWYGFHGTVDEFRIWEGDLLQEEVAQLASGATLRDETALWHSLRGEAATEGEGLGVRMVRCTRPVERTYEQM
jgi:hypothetical protein